jgi:hypothetical protein
MKVMEKEEIEKLAFLEIHKNGEMYKDALKLATKWYVRGYQQAQEEQNRKAAMINPPNLDDVLTKQDRGVCKDCYYTGAFTCEH